MTNEDALQKAIDLLAPFVGSAWERNSNLKHLHTLTRHLPKNSSVFDAGCGLGVLALALSFLDYRVEGGDKYVFTDKNSFTVKDLEKLRSIWKQNGLNILDFDILKDELPKKYDAVVSIATIEHQQHPRFFLEKLKNMIKDGGWLYIATPNPNHLLNRLRFFLGRPASNNIEEFFYEDNFVGHWREYTIQELKNLFEWSGFEIVYGKNRQELKPDFFSKGFRGFYISLFRVLAKIWPGTGDANVILARKKAS